MEIFVIYLEQKISLFSSVENDRASRRIDQFGKNYVESRLDAEHINGIWSGERGEKRTEFPLSRSISRVGNDWNKRLKHYFHAIQQN